MFAFSEPGFCPDCGAILPYMKEHTNNQCFVCQAEFGPEVYGAGILTKYTIRFNNFTKKKKVTVDKGDDGPVVERNCPKCGNNSMSYATLQLRSADEGQTVFYTCTKCKFKETENS